MAKPDISTLHIKPDIFILCLHINFAEDILCQIIPESSCSPPKRYVVPDLIGKVEVAVDALTVPMKPEVRPTDR